MKCYARYAAILVMGTTALASAQMLQKPLSPQVPSRVNTRAMSPNHLRKVAPGKKIAGPKAGQKGAGVPRRGKTKGLKKMKNGSK